MTRTARMAAIAITAILSGIALMMLMQAGAPHHEYMMHAAPHGPHGMAAMWDRMGWRMALGPAAMLLFLGGMVAFVTMIVRAVAGCSRA